MAGDDGGGERAVEDIVGFRAHGLHWAKGAYSVLVYGVDGRPGIPVEVLVCWYFTGVLGAEAEKGFGADGGWGS